MNNKGFEESSVSCPSNQVECTDLGGKANECFKSIQERCSPKRSQCHAYLVTVAQESNLQLAQH